MQSGANEYKFKTPENDPGFIFEQFLNAEFDDVDQSKKLCRRTVGIFLAIWTLGDAMILLKHK